MKKSTYNHIIKSLELEIDDTFEQKDYETTLDLIYTIDCVFSCSNLNDNEELKIKIEKILIDIFNKSHDDKKYNLTNPAIRLLSRNGYFYKIVDDEFKN